MADEPAQSERRALRARLAFAGAAAVALGVLVTLLALAGSGSEEHSNAAAAPKECLRSWNSDRAARADGRHNALAHNYTEVQVGYMASDGGGSVSGQQDGRECAVVFARATLDPEVEYAGEIQLEGDWTPLSALVGPAALAALQSDALGGANARPTELGTLVPP